MDPNNKFRFKFITSSLMFLHVPCRQSLAQAKDLLQVCVPSLNGLWVDSWPLTAYPGQAQSSTLRTGKGKGYKKNQVEKERTKERYRGSS